MAILKQGSTTLNAGAKGAKGDMPSFTINSTPIVNGSEVVIEGGEGMANTFTASLTTLVDVANANKTAIVSSPIDLSGVPLNLQKGMTLQFNGGSFFNGTINWNNNPIIANPLVKLFENTNTSHTGVAYAQDIFVEWFGAVADGASYINALDGNEVFGTLGLSPTDRSVEFMNICKGGTWVFSDTSAEYYINIGGTGSTDFDYELRLPEDGIYNVKRRYGIKYTASHTSIRIDKGVVLRGAGIVNLDYTSVIAIFRCDNVTIYGGGHIKGDKYTNDIKRYIGNVIQSPVLKTSDGTETSWDVGRDISSGTFSVNGVLLEKGVDFTYDGQIITFVAYTAVLNDDWIYNEDITGENGIGITFASKCENLVVDGITLSEMAGDGFAFSNDHNAIDENGDKPTFKPSSYTQGTLNFDGTVTPDGSKDQWYSNLMALSVDVLLYDYTILLAYYNSYEGTDGLFNVAFYDISDNLIEYGQKRYMYEYLYFPEGAAKMRISFYLEAATYPKYNYNTTIADGVLSYVDVTNSNGIGVGIGADDNIYLTSSTNYIYGQLVRINGVDQVEGVGADYTISDNGTGSRITFTSTPANGASIYVEARVNYPLEMLFRPDTYVNNLTIKNCEIFDVNRNGISVTVAQNVLIDNCYIHDIDGLKALTSGIDIEDGFKLNRYITIQNSRFKNCGMYDVVTLGAQDVTVKDCVMLPITGGFPTLVRITSGGDGTKIINCKVYGGTVGVADKAVMSGCQLVDVSLEVSSGYVDNTVMHDSYLRVLPEEACYFTNISIINTFNKTSKEVLDINGDPKVEKTISIGGNNEEFQYKFIYPKVTFDNITIDGNDTSKSFAFGNKNTTIRNLNVINSTTRVDIYAKYAENVQCLESEVYIYPQSEGTTIKGLKTNKVVYVENNVSNFLTIDGLEMNTESVLSSNEMINLLSGNHNNITIQNSKLTPTTLVGFNAYFVRATGSINNFSFINNKLIGTSGDATQNTVYLVGTNTGLFLYKENQYTDASFVNPVGSITYNNIIDGVKVD